MTNNNISALLCHCSKILLDITLHFTTGVCSRDKVSVVLIELERRHTLEDKIKWDFMLLGGGSPGISLDNVYILFKVGF